jgi:hypothetical protein
MLAAVVAATTVRYAASSSPRTVAVASPTPNPTLNPVFAGVLPTIKADTQLPVMLPSLVVNSSGLYTYVDLVDANDYAVGLSYLKNCTGARYCEAGLVQSIPSPGSVSLANDTNTAIVTLNNGITAYIGTPLCGASCLPPYIEWISGNRDYSISFNGNLTNQNFIDMANSMTTY